MSSQFCVNDYCEAQQPDGQWYRGTVQGGPWTGNGGTYYRVHVHHPLNKHAMIWTTLLRPYPNDYGDSSSFQLQLSAPYGSSAPLLNMTMMPFLNRFAAFTDHSMGSIVGSTGLVIPQTAILPSVVPSKRPLDVGQQRVTPIVKAKVAQPGLPKTKAGVAGATPAVCPAAAAIVAEPAAKRPHLLSASNMPTARSPTNDTTGPPPALRRSLLALLEGPVVEVCVTQPSSQDLPAEAKTWGVPKALLSHSSPFFEVATRNVTDAYSKTSIDLPGFQPAVFAMFLEWMYWGSYNAPDGVLHLEYGHDIDAWILGDKLEAAGFQNVAMNRLYLQYTASASLQPLTIETVTHVCARTATGSLLHLFLLDVLAQNFTNTEHVKGTLEDWDVALQEYPDARLLLLAGFRTYGSSSSFVKAKKKYLVDPKEARLSRDTRSATRFGTAVSAASSHANDQVTREIKSEIKEEPREN